MDNNSNKDKSFLHRWRSSQLAHHPGVVTFVLALMLVLCLLIAQTLVWSRSRTTQAQMKDLKQARQNAQNLIRQVADQGLDSYFDRKTLIRYYLIQLQDRNIGFAASYLQPRINADNEWIFQAGDLYYFNYTAQGQTETRQIETLSTVANDLSAYSYSKTIIQSLSPRTQQITQQQQNVINGALTGSFSINLQKFNLPPHKIAAANFVPPQLIDFFASLIARQSDPTGAAFATLDIESRPGIKELTHLDEFRVKPQADIDKDILDQHPDGFPAQTFWFQSQEIANLYFDHQNQLIWQKNQSDSLELTPADKTVLLQAFPVAADALENWLRKDIQQTDDWSL